MKSAGAVLATSTGASALVPVVLIHIACVRKCYAIGANYFLRSESKNLQNVLSPG